MVLKHPIKKRMAFRSKLARYNTVCCEQVMPVPVIPVCAIGKYRPVPICPLPVIPYCVCDSCDPPAEPSDEPVEMPFSESALQSTLQTYMKKNRTIPHYSPLQDHPTGTIVTHSSNTIPSGYLPCDGRLLSRNDYPILFLMIQTTYGGDDSRFALPYLEHTDSTSIFYLIKI
jgi:hypothetical protein